MENFKKNVVNDFFLKLVSAGIDCKDIFNIPEDWGNSISNYQESQSIKTLLLSISLIWSRI